MNFKKVNNNSKPQQLLLNTYILERKLSNIIWGFLVFFTEGYA